MKVVSFFDGFLYGLAICTGVLAASRTSPPAGAVVVRAGTTATGEFKTISSAVAALPNDSSSRSIFIFPGTYSEQVSISRAGPVAIYGYTQDTSSYSANQVTITAGIPASAVGGSNDLSGTLRVHKNDFKMYNVNVRNTFGPGSQAIALSNYGSRTGFYACGFFGFQDTLLANQGTQVYLKGYIEGAVDFIFGRLAQAYFGGNTIAVTSKGYITASGREADNSAIYVFNNNKIVLGPNAASNTTNGVYLGRPWGNFAKVVFKNTYITLPMNKAIWSIWHDDEPRTDHILFAEFNTTGPGVSGAQRPTFATLLSTSQAAGYTIATTVGSDYASWVDSAYVV